MAAAVEHAHDSEMSNAWLKAAVSLGIRVIAPYPLILPDGITINAEAYIADFGGPNGTIAINAASPIEPRRCPDHYCSVLYPSYRNFDRPLFIETLNDWGWFGPDGSAPAWYSGPTPEEAR